MSAAKRDAFRLFEDRHSHVQITHTVMGSPHRQEAERFIRETFARHYNARVKSFAPNLALFEQHGRLTAVTGWRAAADEPLFLERYLDQPIEETMARLTGAPVARGRIVEVGNLAAEKPGGSLHVILSLARHFSALGYEWVVFTATRELVGIFSRLGLPLLALAPADPRRLGQEAADWGSYYDAEPIVVAGRIRLGLERMRKNA